MGAIQCVAAAWPEAGAAAKVAGVTKEAAVGAFAVVEWAARQEAGSIPANTSA